MILKRVSFYVTLLVCCVAAPSWGEEAKNNISLDDVVVRGRQSASVFEAKDIQPDTESTVTREGLQKYGGAGQINSFKAIDILPSVNFQSADVFGLTNNRSIRVRGQTRVASTVDGLSLLNYGLDPGISDTWLFDIENLEEVTLYRGAVSPDMSLVPYNTGGTMNRSILRPRDQFGVTLHDGIGTFGFNKIFTRIDSGLLPSKTKVFASFSHTEVDKWKGIGGSRADIASFGISQNLPAGANLEMFGTYSNPETYGYRALTYAQTQDLGNFYRYDFNKTLTGNAAQDVNYYGYNRDAFRNYAIFGNLEIPLPGKGRLAIKPYYANEDGYTLTGVGNILGSAGVRKWDIVHDNYGVVAQYDTPLMGTDLTIGYWYAVQEPPGPPTAQRAYRVVNGNLTFAGWAILANPTENHEWNSPYLTIGKQLGDFYLKAGVRYVYEELPSINLYSTANVPDVSYPDVLNYPTNINPAGSVRGRLLREWLPNFGVDYAISKQLNAYFSYGRNFGRSAFDVWTIYPNNQAAFTKKGLTAQYLWNQVKPEITDNFDLGVRYNGRKGYVAGTLFGIIARNKGVSVTDPTLGIKYIRNIADAIGYGAELEASVSPVEDLNAFVSASYNRFEFTDNIVTGTNSVTLAKGKQVPDSPEFETRAGVTYNFHGLSLSPILRYTGKRFGDVENAERIPEYAVFDLNFGYTKKNILWCKVFSAGISFLNLFNTHYIGIINASDDSRQGSTSYYAGAPLTVVANATLKF
jgi:iron complex outermembrane receptor protein